MDNKITDNVKAVGWGVNGWASPPVKKVLEINETHGHRYYAVGWGVNGGHSPLYRCIVMFISFSI